MKLSKRAIQKKKKKKIKADDSFLSLIWLAFHFHVHYVLNCPQVPTTTTMTSLPNANILIDSFPLREER